MSSIVVLTCLYGVAGIGFALAWRYWRRTVKSIEVTPCLRQVLVILYWCLSVSLLCTSVLSLRLWQYHNNTAQRRILFGICFGVILQTAAFALLFTPILMYRRRQRTGFWRKATISELMFVLPVLLLIGFSVWLFLYGPGLIQ